MLSCMRVAALFLACLCMLPSVAAEIYRYVDPENGVEFSDTPRPGAERIVIPDAQRAPATRLLPPAPAAPAVADVATGTAVPYEQVRITDPLDQETVRDNSGNMLVSVALKPGLQAPFGHKLQLLLDGESVSTGTAINFSLTGIDRGTHTLQVIVLGADDAPLASSPTTTFHLHRAVIQRKQPPVKPGAK
jgi:hypothetical protein